MKGGGGGGENDFITECKAPQTKKETTRDNTHPTGWPSADIFSVKTCQWVYFLFIYLLLVSLSVSHMQSCVRGNVEPTTLLLFLECAVREEG